MLFTSTRNNKLRVKGSEAVLSGLAPDGGLFVPVELPKLSKPDLEQMLEMDYPERSAFIMSKLFDELSFDELKVIARRAYSTFDGDPAPIVGIDENVWFMELYHGKTHAFKDMALSVLPLLMTALKEKAGQKELCLIPVATSGDTGKAALEGFSGVEGTGVYVFYPDGGVSATQRKQMVTTLGDNVCVSAIKGNFDDAQTAVKKCFTSIELKEALKECGAKLTGANSINFGRLAPQIAYYVSGYLDLVGGEVIKMGEEISYTVPTGNFGNILAAYYAKKMGVPIKRLVCASNENNVLTEFISTGVYSVDRPFLKTMSPSMDILVSSNLERFLFDLAGKDSMVVKGWMEELKSTGRYDIGSELASKLKDEFTGGYAEESECADAIGYLFDEYGYLVDPHTAVGYAVGSAYSDEGQMIFVSTASPVKFAASVLSSIGESVPSDDKKALLKLEKVTAFDIPQSVSDLFGMEERFTSVISTKEVQTKIVEFAKKLKSQQ